MSEIADELVTLRDILRYTLSRFGEADIVFGHGTSDTMDDAVFLILETLHLPIDDINPWLDARLTLAERRLLVERIDRRVNDRVPTPYLVNKAYIQGLPFYIDDRVIVPRSFIGELLVSDFFDGDSPHSLIGSPETITAVADICTGSGCLAILAAKVFPNAMVDAVDISPDALAVAEINVEALADGQVSLYEGDLFAPLGDSVYELIITNPPYVDSEAMAGLADEYLAEPALALDGGLDGLDVVRRILAEAGRHLTEDGGLLCEVGTGRDMIEIAFPDLPFVWLDTEESEGEVFWLPAGALRPV